MSAKISDLEHELKNTRPTRATQPTESAFHGGRPKMPDHFAEAEAKVWKRIVKILAARKTLTKGDGEGIELYVQQYMRHRALLDELKTHGEMIDEDVHTSGGDTYTRRVLNPAGKAATSLENSLRQLIREIGGTPLTREKAKPAKAAPRVEEYPVGSVGWILKQRGEEYLLKDDPKPAVVDEEPEMED